MNLKRMAWDRYPDEAQSLIARPLERLKSRRNLRAALPESAPAQLQPPRLLADVGPVFPFRWRLILGDRINGLLFVRGQLDKWDGIGRGTAGKIPWKLARADRAVFPFCERVALVAGRLRLRFIRCEPGFLR